MGLQHGIKEVFNLHMVNYATDEPILTADYAETTTNETAAERLELRGGWGNRRLMDFDHTKTTTLVVTLPLVDLKMLAYLGGDELAAKATDVYKREELTVSGTEITLSEEAVDNTVYVFEKESTRDLGDTILEKGSSSTKTVDLGGTYAGDGDEVIVYYFYETAATARVVNISAASFPDAVSLFGDGLWRDEYSETDKAVKMLVYKAKPQSNFTLTMSGTEATSLEITFDVYGVEKDGEMTYVRYVVLDD